MAIVYLIPTVLAEGAIHTIPMANLEAIQSCTVLFAENIKTARRFLRLMDKSIIIDAFEWHAIHKAEQEVAGAFREAIRTEKTVGIISEAGCPGIADPGQILVAIAQEMNATVKPLTGPNSMILALMASGLNGQQFEFCG